MPIPDKITTKVEGRNLTLTNLDKVLFEDGHFVKAQLIEYYMQIQAYMLPMIENRPMTFIRFPEGSKGHKFFSKNKPSWTPNWINSVKVGEDEIDYILINKLPELVWAANLAALELHPMTVRSMDLLHPDLFILDLDPPTDADFERVKILAKELKLFFEKMGFFTFLKTSGSKGLHLFVPIKPNHTHEEIVGFLKEKITIFIKDESDATLNFNKEKREGKILIDILRNNKSQTCVAAFSTRGLPSASVSMPIHWDDLAELASSQAFTMANAVDYIHKKGNPWQSFFDFAVDLPIGEKTIKDVKPKLPPKLEAYHKKRDFTKTTEPSGMDNELLQDDPKGLRFVVQLHDASSLHYDLRLENEGVLQSWAIPKGLPVERNEKRLAIKTEDHPLKYLTFEGLIPEKQYGAGEMWVFETGNYKVIKSSNKSIEFDINGKQMAGIYSLFQTKDDQWLIERKSEGVSEMPGKFEPMLAELTEQIPDSADYFFEIKWDGIRINLIKNHDEISIISRGGRDISKQFPEILEAAKEIKVERISLDGELVVLDRQGKPVFAKIISRMHAKKFKLGQNTYPSTAYFFDLLYLDGIHTASMDIERRKSLIKCCFPEGNILRYSDTFSDGHALWDAVKTHGLEGMICKHKGSKYFSTRSKEWLKIKVRSEEKVFIAGYTLGQGDRSQWFGSLHLVQYENGDTLKYCGKVGTGFDQATMANVFAELKELPVIEKPFSEKVDEESNSVWVTPTLACKVKYASVTANGTFREPVFMGLVEQDNS